MELWIRSQNKHSLSKVYDLQLDSFNAKKDKVLIINSRTNTDCIYLAEYDTVERALEVLDEIQNKIAKLNYQNHFLNKDFNLIESNIYEMPEE